MEKFSDTPPLFATADVDLFKSLYEEVSESVVTTSKCPTPAMSSERDFTIKVLERNVLHGSSHFCGLLAYACYEYFAEEPLTKESCRMAMLAGWCSELLEASHRAKEDIMKAEQLTKIDNGTITLRYFFGENTCYLKLREAGRTSCWKNLCGTNLSINAGRNGTSEESSNLTMERYNQIVKLTKGSRMVLPVISGIILAGKGGDKEMLRKVENIIISISQLMHVQNDFYSVFGMEATTELLAGPEMVKNMILEPSNTIRDVSWLLVKVLENPLVDPETAKFFADNLHASDPKIKSRIKEILVDAGIVNSFKEYIDEALANVLKSVKNNFSDGFEGRQEVPLKFFSSFLNTIKYSG